jgi:hypothetical protein
LVLHRLEHSDDADFTRRLGDWLRKELPGFLTRAAALPKCSSSATATKR